MRVLGALASLPWMSECSAGGTSEWIGSCRSQKEWISAQLWCQPILCAGLLFTRCSKIQAAG